MTSARQEDMIIAQTPAVAIRPVTGLVVDPLDLSQGVASFLRNLEGRNASAETIRAYTTSLSQFLAWLRATDKRLGAKQK